MNAPNVHPLTINTEPYLYFRCSKRTFLWMNISRTKYTIVDPDEYILIDRHFNCFFMTEAQMNVCIATDFRRWKRPDIEPINPPDMEDDDAD